MDDWTRGYIEAAIDTDGSVSLHKSISRGHLYYTPSVRITNTSKEWVEFIKFILEEDFGIMVGKIHETPPPIAKSNISFNISINRQTEIKRLLSQIILFIKEEQRQLLLEAIELMSGV